MKNIGDYGVLQEDEWEVLPWLPYPRPPFKIWLDPKEIAPFFIVEHHPYSISLLLQINTNFKKDVFHKAGLNGSSKDWETIAKKWIKEYEKYNSGEGFFHFDSDEDIFCVFSQYIDDLLLLARCLRKIYDNEEEMLDYLK